MADEQRQRWFRNLVQGAGPGMQINLFLTVQLAQTVMKVANRERGRGLLRLSIGPA